MRYWLLCILTCLCINVFAADEENAYDAFKGKLEDKGIALELGLINEYIHNYDGGLRTGDMPLWNLDITLEMDTEKLGLWSNGRFFIYGLFNFHNDKLPTEYVGDIQATSNIEAPETGKIYELWYEHFLLDNHLSLLFGLHDYNSEFSALETAGLFTNSSFGISPDISQIGPSIFPSTALALRLSYQRDETYLLMAAYDGVPGDPDNPNRTQIIIDSDDGIFYSAEIGRKRELSDDQDGYKYGIGFWHHTEYADFDGDDSDNSGIYAIAEYITNLNSGHQLGVFLQLGAARESLNPISQYIGTGFSLGGLFHDNDSLGLAVAHAIISDDFKDTVDGMGLDDAETAIELTYRIELNDHLALQPGIQHVINPSSAADIKDATQFYIRAELSF